MLDFKNCIMKIMLRSPSRHLVRLQRKLKLSENLKNLHILKLISYFSIFQCTSHPPFWVADLGWSVNHVKSLISSCLQLFLFFFFRLWERGAAARQALPPLGCASDTLHSSLHVQDPTAAPDYQIAHFYVSIPSRPMPNLSLCIVSLIPQI
jgi:hypothetical protein